ncbi:MAG: cupin domain-containing protein [Methyloceanibacter sp.]
MKNTEVIVFAAAALSLFAAFSLAQPVGAASKVSRTILERTDIPGTNDELRLTLVEFPPSKSAPLHFHPVPGVCYVLEGTAETQYDGGPVEQVSAGESFHDVADTTHTAFRNVSDTEIPKFICTAKIGKNQKYYLLRD